MISRSSLCGNRYDWCQLVAAWRMSKSTESGQTVKVVHKNRQLLSSKKLLITNPRNMLNPELPLLLVLTAKHSLELSALFDSAK